RAQLTAAVGQTVFDARRARIDHLPLEDARGLEVGEPLCERRRRDAAERLQELVEANRALVRDVEDRDGPAALEEVRRTTDLLGKRPTATTAHAPAAARVRTRAPRPGSSPGGTSCRCAHPRGCRRGRPG